MRLRHCSLKTEKSSVYYLRGFILFHDKCHSKDMGAADIRDYLTHLAVNQNVAASTQNVALSVLLFLYRHVLHIEPLFIGDIERAQKPQRLPVVFTRSEVKAILDRLVPQCISYATCLPPWSSCAPAPLLVDVAEYLMLCTRPSMAAIS
jgi:site-specific recombinase XerD